MELADGKLTEATQIHRGCKLDLSSQIFDVNLIPVVLGSFDIVVGMDWLSKHRAEILCNEKIVRVPLPNGEILSIQGPKVFTEGLSSYFGYCYKHSNRIKVDWGFGDACLDLFAGGFDG